MIFTNLIASCLLACGVAASSVRVPHDQHKLQQDEQMYLDTPKSAVNGSAIYYGFYTWKPITQSIIDHQLFDHDLIVYIDTTPERLYISRVNAGLEYYGIYDRGVMTLTYISSTNSVRLDILAQQVDDVVSDINFKGADYSWSTIVHPGDDSSDIMDGLGEYFSFYLADYMYLTGERAELFNFLFTNTYFNTDIFVSYTGWFYFNQRLPTVNRFFTIPAFITTNDGNYTCLYYYTSLNGSRVFTYDLTYKYGSTGEPVVNVIYLNDGTSTKMKVNRSVYLMNAVIPVSTLDEMHNVGVFSNVPIGSTDYTGFGDLFVSIADTPVRFVTAMFNFELFGINFSSAFFSIVTVIVIVFILRKVI